MGQEDMRDIHVNLLHTMVETDPSVTRLICPLCGRGIMVPQTKAGQSLGAEIVPIGSFFESSLILTVRAPTDPPLDNPGFQNWKTLGPSRHHPHQPVGHQVDCP